MRIVVDLNGFTIVLGPPMARLETLAALSTLTRRLVAPRLIIYPTSYRENASLRGPWHLTVIFDRIGD